MEGKLLGLKLFLVCMLVDNYTYIHGSVLSLWLVYVVACVHVLYMYCGF